MQHAVTLYRGLCVDTAEAERIEEQVRTSGIAGDEGAWRFRVRTSRPDGSLLRREGDTSLEDVALFARGDDEPGYRSCVCACGDLMGATHYAMERQCPAPKGKTGLVVTISAALEDLVVDGRDFLYTAFGLWDRGGTGFREKQHAVLVEAFGGAVAPYFERATATSDAHTRKRACDLACVDAGVVAQHAGSEVVLRGRYDTVFRSAFFVPAPIPPNRILAVEHAREEDYGFEAVPARFASELDAYDDLPIWVSLDDFIAGRL